MTSHQVVLSREAQRNLDEIEAYILEQSGEGRAAAVMTRLQKTMHNLAAMPGMGRRKPYVDRNTRSFPVLSWTIFYTLREDGITVVRILHGHRDLPSAFRGVR